MADPIKGGTVVRYSEDGSTERYGFFVHHDGDKDVIQIADGTEKHLTYREPGDRDSAGSGQTWWKA